MPLFSLVIPTLRRADTLQYSLATLLRQPRSDAEIIVQNNGGDPEIRNLVEEIGDARVRHVATESVVSMCENWERALDQCLGEWIIFIGDDDGLLPDACTTMSALEGVEHYEIVTWTPFLYVWPEYYDERRRNRIEAEVDSSFRLRPASSRELLERFYRFEEHYSRLPMVYNSFVRRSLIERVRAEHGKYFFGSLPDVVSGIVNAAATDVFVRSTRPLSIAGVSRHSTGHNTWRRTDREIVREDFERDFPILVRDDPEYPAWNFELALAREMDLLRDAVLGGDTGLRFEDERLVRYVADAVNDRPDQYEQTVAVVESMVRRFGLNRDSVVIPRRIDRPPVVPVGDYPISSRRVRRIIDGDELNLHNIDDAAQFAASLLPEEERAGWDRDEQAIPVVSTTPLSFAADGTGERALVEGWSDGEAWGTWAVGPESRIRFSLRSADSRRLALKYRVIAGDATDPLVVECAAGATTLERWAFGPENHRGQLTIDLPADWPTDGDIVELTFRTANPRSPAELGLGPDLRRLGIGVEALRVVR